MGMIDQFENFLESKSANNAKMIAMSLRNIDENMNDCLVGDVSSKANELETLKMIKVVYEISLDVERSFVNGEYGEQDLAVKREYIQNLMDTLDDRRLEFEHELVNLSLQDTHRYTLVDFERMHETRTSLNNAVMYIIGTQQAVSENWYADYAQMEQSGYLNLIDEDSVDNALSEEQEVEISEKMIELKGVLDQLESAKEASECLASDKVAAPARGKSI